jgi:peptide/nickel transport system substrate-binding protein
VVDSSFTDTTALFDALLSGTINLFPAIPLVHARAQLAARQVQILQSSLSAQPYAFIMRVDKGPFVDNRIRTAFKLFVNRRAMLEGAFSGFGAVAYDLQGAGCEYYAADLKRPQDVERAKSLFKAAGVAGETFRLPTSVAWPGMVESATIFAEQAPAAGIKIAVDVTSAATYFVPSAGYLSRPFGQEVNQPLESLAGDYSILLIRGAPFSDTHWTEQPGGAADQRLINEAMAAIDPTRAQALWREVQLQQFNQGGFIWWGNLCYVDAAAPNVRGLTAGAAFNFNNWRLVDGWLS